MARHERMLIEAPQETLDFFIGRQDSSGRKVDPDAEGRMQGPARGPQSPAIASSAGPLLPQTVGVNGNGPGSGVTPCGTPPDTMGAVGPTQFISFVNCNIVSYAKSTGLPDGVLNTIPNNFFNSVRSSGTSDPHVRYDRTSQRWFLSIIDVTFPANRLLLAVSNTSTITASTTWGFFFVSTAIGTHTNCLADYPTPGVDANAIYVGVNQFCGTSLATSNYAGSDLIVIQKASVLGAGPIHATGFPNLGSFTPQGVDNADPAATEGYVIATSNLSFSQLDLFRVSSPGSLSPTRSAVVNVNTANQGTPATQPHKGNTGGANGNIDGSDNRLFAATFRDGSLWTAMTVGTTAPAGNCIGTVDAVTPTRNAVFWWEFKGIPTGSTPSINQAGIVCDAAATNPSFYSYATIAPNGQGQAAVGFTIAGSVNFLSAGTAGRLVGDTPGSLQAINIYGPGVAAYNPAFDNGNANGLRRWGDFSFTSLDPCDDQSLWTIQEYVPVANQYGTRFAQLKAPPPATPVSASPPTVAAGQAAVSVVVTGTPSAGSGFYDTPASLAGEPCRTRIASSIPGVAVNSVTWNSPTQVTLSLNTTAATSGAKTVTITNPDGQSASGAVLTITTACTPPSTPTASNTGPYCAGATVALSTPTVPGATYSWTGPNSFTSVLQNPTIPAATTAATGAYSVTVTVAGCTSAPGTTSVVVNPVPATPTASNTGPYCAGATVALSTPTVPGATYSWTGPNSFTSALQNPTIPAATTAATGAYSVRVTVAGCASAPGTTSVVVNPTPATPVITAPASTVAGTTGLTASVVPNAGSSWFWTVQNGTITAGQATNQVTFTAGIAGTPLTLSVTETNAGCVSAAGHATVTVTAPPVVLNVFYPLPPCRVIDTRKLTAPLGAPPLQPGLARTFNVAASCGIPADALAISVNLTVTNVGAQGELVVFPSDIIVPPHTSAISFGAGVTRANNAIVSFSKTGATFSVFNSSAAPVDFILDVNGFFR